MNSKLRAKVTIGIITALEKEFAAVKLMINDHKEDKVPGAGAGRRFLIGKIPSEHFGEHVIAVAMLPEIGTNSAAIVTT